MTSPCVPECQQRSADCRLRCEAFKKYYAAKQEKYKQQERERIIDDTVNDHIVAVKRKYRRTIWKR